MRVHPDAWVLDGEDNNLTEIKSSILKILHRNNGIEQSCKTFRLYKIV
jgi:hypothetical protein